MRLSREYKIEKVASKDLTRQHICHPHLDTEKKHIAASNGFVLALVPVEVEPSDQGGAIPSDACKAARGAKHIRADRDLAVCEDVRYVRPGGVQFPPIDQMIPAFKAGDGGTVTFTITPRLLMELAAAIGQGGKRGMVSLTVKLPEGGQPMLDPILVKPSDPSDPAMGVLMPARP